LLDQITQVESFTLAVDDLVTDVSVALLEEVHNWQDLSVVGHKSFTNSVRAGHERLQNFESDSDDFTVTGVQGG
jgi:hypothetical protein